MRELALGLADQTQQIPSPNWLVRVDPMRTNVPEMLLTIIDEIDACGSANLTRLAVLQPWFERPGRLSDFGLWIAKRAAGRKGKTKGEAGTLLNEARDLLGTTATRENFLSRPDRDAARLLHDRARNLQNEFDDQPRGPERINHCRPLLLLEQGLALHLGLSNSPSGGYKLAANFCQHTDARHGSCLTGPSATKILELVRFMFFCEAIEENERR